MNKRRWTVLLLLIAVPFAALLFLLYSESGLRLGVFLLTDVFVKQLSVSDVQGRLAGPLTLEGIEYNDGEKRLSLASLSLDWKPSALLTGTAHITDLTGQELHFEQQGEQEATSRDKLSTLPPVKLPLRLVLDSVAINGINIKTAPGATPFSITHIAVQAETERHTLHLHSLRIDSNRYGVEAKGTLRPVGNYKVDLEVGWHVVLEDNSNWKGQGTLQGDLSKLTIMQQLTAPFDARAAVTAKALLEALTWEGNLTIPRLKSSQLPYPVTPAFTLAVELEASGGLEQLSGKSSFSGEVEQLGEIEGRLQAGYAEQRLVLERLQITRPKGAARLEASGNIELTQPLRYRLIAGWESLAWPLDSELVRSDSGQLELTGEDQQYRISSELQLRGNHIPKGSWQVQANGDRESLDIQTLEGKLLEGTVSGHATIGLTPAINWQGNLEGRKINPAGMWPEWPGRLAFDSTISGELSDKGPSLAVTLTSIEGSLRDRPVKGRTEASWQNGVAAVKQLELHVGTAHLQAEGKIGDELMISAQLDAPDLQDLLPQGRGSIKASATLSGSRTMPKTQLQLQGRDLAFGEVRADSLLADIELDLEDRAPSHVRLQLEQLQLPGFEQQTVTLTARGPLSSHTLKLNAQSDKQTLTLEAGASYSEQRWAGMLTTLQIIDSNAGRWDMMEPASFSWTPEAARLDTFCLEKDEANLCSSGQWQHQGLRVDLRSVSFPLTLLAPYLPQRFSIEGELNGTASLNILRERPPSIEAKLTIGEGWFHLIDPVNEQIAIPFRGIELQLDTAKDGTLQGEMSVASDEIERFSLSLQSSLAGGWPGDITQHPLTASLNLSLRDPDFISLIIPEIQKIRGAVAANIRLSGVLASPRLSGTASFSDGSLEIPRLGLNISQLGLTATGDNTRQMDIAGKAHSGEGEITLDGHLRPLDSNKWSLELSLTGEKFEVARIPEARVQISPDLTVRIVGREIHLEGKLAIPSARLEPPDISLAVKPSSDVVIVGEEKPEAEKERWLIHTRVLATAEDSIRFIGYGFNGRIGGELLLIDEPGSLTKARGQLQAVPGSTYKSFGKELTIEQGRINFADSPLDNPNLDIRASRKIGDVTAGVKVTGTALNPTLTLYSEPPMDQADILSYLTLGHPMNSASQSEGEALAGAANSAGLVGGNYLAGYLGRQFGLEEARIEAGEDSQSPWVVAGKYLSPRLYVRYGVGVYEDAYSVLVRYQLSEHWQIQGEGGLHSGGDIIYTFERP